MPEKYSPPSPRDISSPGRFLFWLIRSQRRRIAAGMAFGSTWMVSLALPPYVLSRCIDAGLVANDTAALVGWAAVLLVVGVVNAFLSISRHRTMSQARMDASFRTVWVTVRHSARLGASLSRRMGAGEVVAIGVADVQAVSQSMTVTGPGFGAVIAYSTIAVIMLGISPPLALVVLGGVPLLAVIVGPLLRRMERSGAGYRELQGQLTVRLVDVLSGLRVLNDLGGRHLFAARYRVQSQQLVDRGYQVGGLASWVTALATGLPALFLAMVVWLAAQMAAQGSITVGNVVAVYGYVAVLVVPVSSLIEGGTDIANAMVAAQRIVRLLNLEPDQRDNDGACDVPEGCGPLADPLSGVVVRPGHFTALVSANPADTIEVVARLGRFTSSDATWSGVRVDLVALDQLRERLLVADNDADFFAGTIRDAITGRHEPDDDRIRAALHTAVANDIVEALPAGLEAEMASGGSTLSGGQRQRLRLARAVYADTDVLLAVEPTSAVDAYTEAAMAARLRRMRRRRTTLVTTTSPLVLDQADEVIFLVDGVAIASGRHDQLMRDHHPYRNLVSRATDSTANEEAVS